MLKSPAPDWQVQKWLNSQEALSLTALSGRVVVLYAFQMLCPSCVSHSIPQARKVAALFRDAPVTVVGLHTVFEHFDAMTETALRAFLHEYRVGFPVGIDLPADPPARLPKTMRAYSMEGTPSTLLFDTEGKLRRHVFGIYDDLALGRDIGSLLAESPDTPAAQVRATRDVATEDGSGASTDKGAEPDASQNSTDGDAETVCGETCRPGASISSPDSDRTD